MRSGSGSSSSCCLVNINPTVSIHHLCVYERERDLVLCCRRTLPYFLVLSAVLYFGTLFARCMCVHLYIISAWNSSVGRLDSNCPVLSDLVWVPFHLETLYFATSCHHHYKHSCLLNFRGGNDAGPIFIKLFIVCVKLYRMVLDISEEV